MPPNMAIHLAIIQNLQYCGFEVMNLILEDQAFCYPNLRTRLAVKFKQIVLRQTDAKRVLKDQMMKARYLPQTAHYGLMDYALFIRPDVYGVETIRALKQNVKPQHFIAYQWDGMNRYPYIWQFVELFDRFFVFDPNDIETSSQPQNLLPSTNFYFDYDLTCRLPEKDEFYYIGAHQSERISLINQFSAYAKQHNWQLNFMIYSDKPNTPQYYPVGNIQFIQKTLSYQENLELAKQSRVLVDFVIQEHQGLSLRTFEALAYRKKLISTNTEIIKYDFYHPNNIYVLNEHNFDGLPEFLAKPYYEIDAQIREKYSFSNWIRYILDIPPYQAISLPNINK